MDLTSTTCCQVPKKYSDQYDCYYCEPCNIWSEDKCNDPECEFCNLRPVTPNALTIASSPK